MTQATDHNTDAVENGDVVTIDNYMDKPVVLDVEHVDKWFKLPTEQATGLKQAFINWTKGIKGFKKQQVLKDVTFQVHQGEFFGIVGRNGGGKSTLLKIISQIYYPNRGSVNVTGKLVPFIELGVGFNPELTGRENVYLNGALLGFTPEEVDAVVQDMILKGEIVSSNGNIYQSNVFVQEDETARKIAEMLAVPPVTLDISESLEYVRKNLGLALSQRQSEAVYMAFRSNLSIITGSPGTGKTTVLRAIIEVFQMLCPKGKILLAAPTGRASRRMAESTGRNDAKTLHSLLGLLGDSEPIQRDKQKEPLDADLIIVDESSMIDMWLARQFFSRVRMGTRVILTGDVDQLQSVGAGDVFRELIDSGLIPVTVLNEIFRQKKGSLIAYNAKRINEANIDLQYGEDFQFVKCQTQEEAADLICRIFCEQVALHGIEKVQILSPFRSEGPASVEQLNAAIRELVNPARDEFADLKVGSHYFRVGDKVMQTKNNAKASNGDIGYIRKMGRNAKNEMVVTIEFSGDRIAEYGMEEMVHMELAYATTVHKAMGSEFDIVIMPILRSHYIMLNRNIVYTAITRAKEQVIPVGQKKALIMAILKKATRKRNTQLGERIGKYLKAFTRQNELKKVS